MAVDAKQTTLITDKSSLKLLKQGSGSFVIPGSGGQQTLYGSSSIAHGYGSNELLFQVAADGVGYVTGTILPWYSNDGRLLLYGRIDSGNLHVIGRMGGDGGWGAITVNFSYRIYIP